MQRNLKKNVLISKFKNNLASSSKFLKINYLILKTTKKTKRLRYRMI